jgi:hypothetical protein
MKIVTAALAACDEVIRDSKKLSSAELRRFFEEYAKAQKEILEALRKRIN